MNTFYDQFQRCMRHPHQRIVGVCSSCLHERLTCLVEPIHPTPPPVLHGRKGSANVHVTSYAHESIINEASKNVIDAAAETAVPCSSKADAPMMRGKALTMGAQNGSAPSCNMPRPQKSLEDVRNLRIRTPGRAVCHSTDFARAAPKRHNINVHADAQAEVLVEVSTPSQAQHGGHHGAASASSKLGDDALGKKKASWFFASLKTKPSLGTSISIQVDDKKSSNSGIKSPRHTRASVSHALGSSSDADKNVRLSDLEAIAEANSGDTSRNHITREAGTSTSWISSLFHRRKGPRSRSSLSNNSCNSVANMDTGTRTSSASNELKCHSPKNSIEAGRLSWDGARPNFKQLLKRVEARNSKQQHPDLSPLQFVDYAMKEYNDNGREAVNHTPHLQKSKSVASARSSISFEVPKDLIHSSFTPMIQPGSSNLMVGLEYDSHLDDRNLRRSRSWSRTWNRALSPLWGSRSHRYKGITHESPSSGPQSGHFRAGLVTPSHVRGKGTVTPTSSSRLSPLRGSKLAPVAKTHRAPHGKNSCNASN